MDHITVAQVVTAVVALAAFLGALAKINQQTKRWFARMLREHLAPIQQEMAPNHGGSLKDKVDQIAQAMQENTEALKHEHQETERRHESNVRMIRDLDAEVSVVRQAVLVIALHSSENPRSARLEKHLVDQLIVHEETARDRRHGRMDRTDQED